MTEPSEQGPDAPPAPSGPQARPSLVSAVVRAALTGWRYTSIAVGPIAFLAFVLSLIPTAFGLGTGRGLGIHPMVVRSVGLYVVLALWGTVLGALIGLVAWLLARARGQAGFETRWARANRPIRLWRQRPSQPQTSDTPPARPTTPLPPAPLTATRRARVWPWLIGLPVVSILVTALGLGLYAKRVVDRRLQAAIAAANADDPHWRLDDLMANRAQIPDHQNAALVVAEVNSMLPQSWPGSPSMRLPGQPEPEPNLVFEAYNRLEAAAPNIRLDDDTATTLRDELDTLAEPVQLARTLSDYTIGRHELVLTPDLISTPLKETQDARHVARLLAADAAIRAHDGDPDGALASCRAILGVGRSIGDEPFLISGLVRMAIGSVASKYARRALAQGEPSDEALAALQQDLIIEIKAPIQLQGVRGERAMLDEIIRRIRDEEIPIDALSNDAGADRPIPGVAPWAKVSFDNQRAVGLEWMNRYMAIVRRPDHERAPLLTALEAEIEATVRSRFGAYVATIPMLIMAGITSANTSETRYHAELGATILLLAAERHRLMTGAWPTTISEIDPAILPTPPLDPYTGKSYRYVLTPDRLVIHSLGPNLKDEAGAYDPKHAARRTPDDIGATAWLPTLRAQPAAEPE